MRLIMISCALAAALSVCSVQAASVQTGFSPEGSAERLVIETINSAQQEIRMMGYSFTSPTVTRALADAARRGVSVKIVLDAEGNRSKASQAAMNYVTNAGVEVKTIDKYKIQHDKVLVIDRQTVETGSFNYSASAAKYNSENVVVLHNMPDVAQDFLRHWQSRWNDGQPYTSGY